MQFCEYLNDNDSDNSFHIIKDDDFQLCFQRGVILMLPTIYMIICGIIFITRLKAIAEFYLPTYNVPSIFPIHRPLVYLWLLISISLIIIPIFNIILRFANVYEDKIAMITILQSCCESIAWTFYCIIFIMEQARQLKHSSFTRFYTIWMSFALLKELETVVLRSTKSSMPTNLLIEMIICVIHVLFSVWMFIMHIFPPIIISNGNAMSSYLMNAEYAPIDKSPQWERFLKFRSTSLSKSDNKKNMLYDKNDDFDNHVTNSRSSQPLIITIPSWMKTKTSSTIVRYAVRVKYTGDLTHEAYKYTLWKRFKDFQNIHVDIMNICNKYNLEPPIFPKEYEHNRRRRTLETVRNSLESYINQLWENYEFQKILFQFVRLHEELPHLNDELLTIGQEKTSNPIDISHYSKADDKSNISSYNKDKYNEMSYSSSSSSENNDVSNKYKKSEPQQIYSKARQSWRLLNVEVPTTIDTGLFTLKVHTSNSNNSHTIYRTYDQFLHLQEALRKEVDVDDDSFNFSTLRSNLPIEQRRDAILAFCQQICHLRELQCDSLYDFMMEGNESIPNTPVSGSLIDAMYESMQVNDNMPKPMYMKECVAKQDKTKPEAHHRFDIDIIGWNRDDHVKYNIRIREYYHMDDYIEWYVSRRYSEFEKLQKQLSAQLNDGAGIVTLPKKRYGLKRDEDDDFLERRRIGLERYLQSIINMNVTQSDALYSFISLNDKREITMGSRNLNSYSVHTNK